MLKIIMPPRGDEKVLQIVTKVLVAIAIAVGSKLLEEKLKEKKPYTEKD